MRGATNKLILMAVLGTCLTLALALPALAAGASASPPPTTEWKALGAFPIFLIVFLVLFFTVAWKHVTPGKFTGTSEHETWIDVTRAPLKHLAATWTLSGSPITSVTAAGGLLTAIFANDGTLKAILGVEKAPPLSLAIVGAAISGALIAAAPLALAALNVTPDKKSPRNQYASVAGIRVASSLSMAAALGLIFVVYRTGLEVGMSQTAERWLTAAALLAGALAITYGLRATFQTLRLGLIAPPAAGKSETLTAIELFEKILKQLVPSGQSEAVTMTAKKIEADVPQGASPAEATILAADAYRDEPMIDNALVMKAMNLAASLESDLVAEPDPQALAATPSAMI
jgi:hypothetical protein